MKVKYFDISNVPSIKEDISLCLGYFDGLHQGHLLLCEKALTSKYKSALLTFDFLDNINIKNKAHITSLKDKEEILKSLGFDYLFVLKFDENVMRLTPEEFVENIIIRLNAKEVVIGEDYTFGKGKKGNREFVSLSES